MVPALVLLIGLRLYPILEVFRLSFTHYLLYEPHNIHFAGFKNFQTAIADEVFRLSLKNTGIWVGLSLVGQFFLGLILAMLLNQKFKFRGIIRAVLFLPWAVSGFLIAVMWRWMYQPQIGIINDLLFRIGIIQQRVAFLARADTALLATVVACIWWGIPFFAIMFLSALQTIPQDLYDAAAVDGASVLRQFRNITVPFLAPVMVTTSLLRAIWIFNFVALIYIMTNGGPYNSSQILSSYIYFTASKALDFGLASALAVIALLILLVYAVFYLLITRRVREVW
jgi:multiple sugar transport system permease protein